MTSDYDSVKAAMAAGTPPELICAACPWDRLCISPPTMTDTEIRARVMEARDAGVKAGGNGASAVLTALAVYAGRDSMGDMCPVFALRLRAPEGRQLADSIRALMQAS